VGSIKHILYIFILLLFISNGIKAQTVISGVINDYSRVTDVTNPQCAPCDTTIPCLNKVTVNDPGLFATGDKCLIIQMKGAEIDPTNGIGGGDITNIGNAGNY